jgi:hypothetical protein
MSGSRRRKRSAANGITSSAGNSFDAAPMPNSTPAETFRPRKNASMPAAANATAMRSQFMNP